MRSAPTPNDVHLRWLINAVHQDELDRRLVEQAHHHALEFECRALAQGWTVEDIANHLDVSPRTLQRWRQTGTLPPLGRPVASTPVEDRQRVHALLKDCGPGASIAHLQTHFDNLARAELRRLREDFRAEWKRTNRRLLHVCHWLVPGSVWAMDFAQAPCLIDGLYPYLLAVRDLATGYQLLWQPVTDETAETVMRELTLLFTIYGAPLILKSDNGSAFRADDTKRFLTGWGVGSLYSPPRTPSYNGAIEASIGALKILTQEHATMADRPDLWTITDVDAARDASNARTKGRRIGPSRETLWDNRRPLTAKERATLRSAYEAELPLARIEKELNVDRPLDHWEQSTVDRVAYRRAMVARGYLEFRRRRISPPIKVQKRDTRA